MTQMQMTKTLSKRRRTAAMQMPAMINKGISLPANARYPSSCGDPVTAGIGFLDAGWLAISSVKLF